MPLNLLYFSDANPKAEFLKISFSLSLYSIKYRMNKKKEVNVCGFCETIARI